MPRDLNYPEIRGALNAEGGLVRDLVVNGGFSNEGLDFDWSDIEPHWLVATIDGAIMGCIQICPGKPVGRAEMLCIDKEVSPRQRAMLVKELILSSMATLKHSGSQAVSFLINFEMKSYKRILKKRGAVVLTSGNLMIRRI